jgi:hypothetical protein
VQADVSRAILKEAPASFVPTQQKMVEAPVPVETALIPVSLRGPSFCPLGGGGGGGTTSDDVMFIPVSFNVVDLGASELGAAGLPQCTAPTHQLEATGGRWGVDVLMSCDHGPAAKGDIGHV